MWIYNLNPYKLSLPPFQSYRCGSNIQRCFAFPTIYLVRPCLPLLPISMICVQCFFSKWTIIKLLQLFPKLKHLVIKFPILQFFLVNCDFIVMRNLSHLNEISYIWTNITHLEKISHFGRMSNIWTNITHVDEKFTHMDEKYTKLYCRPPLPPH